MKKLHGLRKRWYMLRDLFGIPNKKYNYKNNYTKYDGMTVEGENKLFKYFDGDINKNTIKSSVIVSNIKNLIKIGENSYISDGCFLQGIYKHSITIGNNCYIATETTIWTTNHNYYNAKAIPFDADVIIKPVTIKDNVWIGAKCIIVPGITIGEGAVVGIGSVVTKNVPPLAIVGGNPATIIKYRDEECYDKLKNAGATTNTVDFKKRRLLLNNKEVNYENKNKNILL